MKGVGPALWLGAILFGSSIEAQRSSARPALQRPKLNAVADLRLTAPVLGLSPGAFGRGAHLGIAPDGRIVVAPTFGEILDLDTAGHRLSWKIPIGGRDAEVRNVERLGWAGNTLWIIDGGFQQIALIDPKGKVTKSLEHPSWVRPSWADRRNFPVFGSITPLAWAADSSWLVIPYRERSVLSTPGYDSTLQYIMKITEGGSIQKVIARVPRYEGGVRFPIGRGNRMVSVPQLGQTRWGVSTDGLGVAIVRVNSQGQDSATFRVTYIGDKGDTVFSRLYPYTPVKISPQSRDSLRERVQGRIGSRSEEEVRNAVAEKIPPFYAPVQAVVIGRDRTIWLLQYRTGEENPWLVLDATGEQLGTVMLSKDYFLEAAERQRAWGFDRKIGQPPVLVRYRITPAARR
jgi:hypothetical protein